MKTEVFADSEDAEACHKDRLLLLWEMKWTKS